MKLLNGKELADKIKEEVKAEVAQLKEQGKSVHLAVIQVGDNAAYSEITLREAIEYVDKFCPVKIVFNGIVLYNDYDENMVEIEDGVYGEDKPPMDVIPDRLWQFDNYVVTSINIEIVEFHHSIVKMQGEYKTIK